MTKIFNRTEMKDRRRTLRNNMTRAEAILWQVLRRKNILGCRFLRQYSVDCYILDFYCPKLKLAIEVDGDSHFKDGAEKYDLNRQRFIESLGIQFLRFTNHEIYQNLNGVCQVIRDKASNMIEQGRQDVNDPENGMSREDWENG